MSGDRDVGKHPTMLRTAPMTKNDLGPDVSSTEVEKSSSNSNPFNSDDPRR